MNLVKTLGTEVGKLGRRIVQVLILGNSDVQTATSVAPYGIDSNPVPKTVGLYAKTGEKGKTVLIGYQNGNSKADIGELRLFSTDQDGVEKTFLWLKKDGTVELAGADGNLVRYAPIESFVSDLNSFLNEQLTLIASGISTGGGSYTPGTAEFDISESKVEELKCS